MRVRLTAGAMFFALLGLAAALAPSADAESTPSAFGSRLVTLINQARAQHGLRALTVTAGTSTVAANWTAHMAQQQALSHNPSLGPQLESHGSPNWTTYAENVADGSTSSADTMFQNYMNSPEHRSNILDAHMRYVGVGVVFTSSLAWNTLDFVDQYNSTTSTTSTSTQTSTSTSTKSTTTTKTRSAAQTPRIAPRTTTTTARTTTKRVAQAPRSAPRQVPHTVPTRHTKPRSPMQKPTVIRRASAAVAPAAHAMGVPSPVALTTPTHGGRDGHTLPLVAALGIVLVAMSRFALRRTLRTRRLTEGSGGNA